MSDVHDEQITVRMGCIKQLPYASLANLVSPQINSSQIGILLDGLGKLYCTFVANAVPSQVYIS